MRADRRRLDKWLWFARLPSPDSCGEACRERFRACQRTADRRCGKSVAMGDVITLALDRATLVVRVVDLGTRRGPAPEARQLYVDLNATMELLSRTLTGARAFLTNRNSSKMLWAFEKTHFLKQNRNPFLLKML